MERSITRMLLNLVHVPASFVLYMVNGNVTLHGLKLTLDFRMSAEITGDHKSVVFSGININHTSLNNAD